MTGIPHSESIKRMEADGTMDRRRAELRRWFAEHSNGSPQDAVRAFDYTFADHMVVVADSLWMDLWRGTSGAVRDRDAGCGAC